MTMRSRSSATARGGRRIFHAAVPFSGLNAKAPSLSNCMRLKSARIVSKRRSVSPGKPVMTVVLSVTPGTAARMRSAATSVALIAARRFMFQRTDGSVCWRGTSTYFAACGDVASHSRKSSPISFGYE